MMKKYILLGLLLVLVIPTVAAIWLENINIFGTAIATSGSRPDAQEYYLSYNFTDDNNQTEEFSYYLKDTESDFVFCLDDSGIYSTDQDCVYDSGYDIKFYIVKDGEWTRFNQSKCEPVSFTHGWNTLNLTLEPSPDRCPFNGSFFVWSEMD